MIMWFLTLFSLMSLIPLPDRFAQAQDETLYMAVLNSRKHRLNANDNPMVGTFMSTDGGRTWQHRGWREYIRTFHVVAGNDGTIWAACGNGVLRSIDGGASWRITTGWDVTEVMKVTVDPTDPSTVYAATAYGIKKTSDLGAHWQTVNNGLRRPFTAEVAVDRTNSRRVLAATEEGVFLSMNGGARWQFAGLKGKGIRTITQDPADPRVFWVGTEDDGVYRSPDRGASWMHMAAGLNHGTVYAIAVDPRQPSVVFAGTHGGGVYKSTDGGIHWAQTNEGLNNLDVHALTMLPSQPGTIFAGTLNGGLYQSTDGGSHWKFNSQEEAQVWGLTCSSAKTGGAGR